MLPDSLIERVREEKLDPVKRAKLFRRLIDEFGLTTGKIAKRIRKSPSYVSNTLRLLDLPEALKDGLVSGLITPGHGRALAAIEDQKMMVAAYKQILRNEGSVREAESLARKIKKKTVGKIKKKLTESFEKMEKGLSRVLGGAKVELSRSRSQTRILISQKGNLDQTEPWLKKIYWRLTKPSLPKGQ